METIKKKEMIINIYNADDEEPNCLKCIHLIDDYNCIKKCGPGKSWNGYRRNEYIVKENK